MLSFFKEQVTDFLHYQLLKCMGTRQDEPDFQDYFFVMSIL
jgi:hypothetical protein